MLSLILNSALAAPIVQVSEIGANGRYTNVIAQASPLADYVEVCFVGGNELQDVHVGGGSTAGGNCIPGNTGFLLELVTRVSATWPAARGACLADGLRLPELWELAYAHTYPTQLGFPNANAVAGWATNQPFVDPSVGLSGNSLEVPLYAGVVVFYPAYGGNAANYLCAM